MNKLILFWQLAFVSLLCLGCGKSDDFVYAKLSKAQGILSINGESPEGAMLIFWPADSSVKIDERGTRPHAIVGADGQYQVTTYKEGDGIPVGDYQVGLLWEENPNTSSSWDKLGGRYANPTKTEFRVTIIEGENQIDPIELTGVRILDRAPRQQPSSADGTDD